MPTKQRNYNKPWDFLTVLFKLHSFQIQKTYIIEEFIFKKLIGNFFFWCVCIKQDWQKKALTLKNAVRRFSFGHEQLNGQNRSRTLHLLYLLFYLCFKYNNYYTFLKKISIMECIGDQFWRWHTCPSRCPSDILLQSKNQQLLP